MAFVEAPQTLEETANVPKLVKGPCLLNMVWRGKTPDLSIEEASGMNYALMILPGLLTRTIVGACDAALAELRAKGRHPVPPSDITPQQGFNLNGAAEWDRYRTQFREPAKRAAE
jgi:2-methylisocitrate lyase-like PEP mutase family enzyme